MTKKTKNQSNTSSFKKISRVLVGVPLTSIGLLIASPFIAKFLRFGCYWWYGDPEWYQSGFVEATIFCENLGDRGFHWQESLAQISNYFQTIVVTAGTGVGLGYIVNHRTSNDEISEDDLVEQGRVYTPSRDIERVDEMDDDLERGFSRLSIV